MALVLPSLKIHTVFPFNMEGVSGGKKGSFFVFSVLLYLSLASKLVQLQAILCFSCFGQS
jgi:hypothetical protein